MKINRALKKEIGVKHKLHNIEKKNKTKNGDYTNRKFKKIIMESNQDTKKTFIMR